MALIDDPASPLVPKLRGLHLFGFDGAPCTQRVTFALGEKGIFRGASVPWRSDAPAHLEAATGTYTDRQISLPRKDHLTDEYAAIQPNMVVPALVHDGRLHIESMDIVRYIDETWPDNPLLPADPDLAALTDSLVEQGKALHRAVRFVSFHWGLKGLARLSRKEEETIRRLETGDSPEQLYDFYSRYDAGTIPEKEFLGHLADLEAGWAEQEARLAGDGRPFLTGDAMSMADIIWTIQILRIEECGYPFARNYPRLADWYARMKQREGFRRGVIAHNRGMNIAFRVKAGIENLLGIGLKRVARGAA